MSTASSDQSPLTWDSVASLLESEKVADPHLQLLRWLVWLPLLSACELGRLMGRDEKTVAGHLLHMEALGLLAHVVLREPGWPRHYRYYATDAGLYVLAARYREPLSVPCLVQSYPVDRDALYARLARPPVHFILSELVSRLVGEGRPLGYQFSYRQPWQEMYTERGSRHRFTTDAALLIGQSCGSQHAFYVRVDAPERIAGAKLERAFLSRLLDLLLSTQLAGLDPPQLLILATRARFPFWAECLRDRCEQRNSRPPGGCITDTERFGEGVYTAIWLPLQALVEQGHGPIQTASMVSLPQLLTIPATPEQIARIAQSFTFAQVRAKLPVPARRTSPLPRYVGDSLQEEAAHLGVDLLQEQLHGSKAVCLQAAAQLSLALSARAKALLTHLARHPLLSLPDLPIHLYPEGGEERLVQRLLLPLQGQGLVHQSLWKEGSSWRERERYQLSELALRFLAVRHDVPLTHYLEPILPEGQEQRIVSTKDPSLHWRQRGAWGLQRQLAHTNGLYRYMRAILEGAHRSGTYRVLSWKSAREAVRYYYHPTEQQWMSVRPDAELLVELPDEVAPLSVLVEYDRGTTFDRDYGAKFEAYSDYQRCTRTRLPPMLFLMQRPQTETAVRQAIHSRHAGDVRVVFVLEADLLSGGLQPVLICLR